MMVLIAFVFFERSKVQVYDKLKKNAYICAWFFLEEDEMNYTEFQEVRKLFDEEVFNQFYQFYNMEDVIEFGYQEQRISAERLEEIRKKDLLAFSNDEFYCYGIFYEDNQGDFVIITKEKKEVVYNQMYTLWLVMGIALLSGVMFILFINRTIAIKAYKPFRTVINSVSELKLNSTELKIKELNSKDELSDLVDTFNKLLHRISESSNIQKNFVRYVSHEFKTPLTAIMGNTEVFLIKARSPLEYEDFAKKILSEITYLEETLNSIIFLSGINVNDSFKEPCRIDDLIWGVTKKMESKYRDKNIKIEWVIENDIEDLLEVNVNTNQIFLAIYNIMDNGLKYSNYKPLKIKIYSVIEGTAKNLKIEFKDYGIGILPDDIEKISKAFYRGSNVEKISGSGIGLTLALQIFEKNNINFNITSNEGKGTCITLNFQSK